MIKVDATRRLAMTAAWVLAATACLPPGLIRAEPLPNFGLMYNNDGDISYPSPDPSTATQLLQGYFGALANTPVKTVMYSIGSGSDVLHYPTNVANNFGWRTTSLDNDPDWVDRVTNGRIYAQAGFDPVRVVGEQVKSMGMYFIPSYRMNDDHFVVDPLDYPLTGEFWINNQDKTVGSSPVAGYDYSNLLNYAYQEVRDYRLAVINESIDRFSDIMDGYELDFNRFQVFFAPGTAQANAPLMTDLVQQVRNKLDAVELQTGRQQHLFVRVPPALHNNDWAGLEVESWMQNGLVDVVIPSVLQTLSHDVPVGEFLPTAHEHGVQVAPSIYPRTNYGWDFQPNPDATTYAGSPNGRVAQPALIRGAASAYNYLGVDGFQMYNFGLPWPDHWNESAEALAAPGDTFGKDRIFAVTPGYFNDDEDNYDYEKQLPYAVTSQNSQQFTVVIGDHIGAIKAENPRSVELRLGLTNSTAASSVTLTINGHAVHAGALGARYFPVSAPVANDAPQGYFQIPINDLNVLRQGLNTIEVFNTTTPNAVRITDLQVGIFSSPGIINPGDSSQFPFRYEGTPPNTEGTTATGFGSTGYAGSISGYQLSSDGAVLDVSESGGPGSVVFLQSDVWGANATDESGWTWEGRFKLNSGRFTLRIGDDQDAHDILEIFDDGRVSSRIEGTLATLESTTDVLHTYRIAQAPGSDEYNVWVDGKLIGLYAAADTGIGTGGPHWWSDGSGSTTGSYELDYIRFATGGFSPYNLPEANADFNDDGHVDGRDFLIWQRSAGSTGVPSTLHSLGDANGDGAVDALDRQILESQFGAGLNAPHGAQVPEPTARRCAAVLWLVAGGLVLLRRQAARGAATHDPAPSGQRGSPRSTTTLLLLAGVAAFGGCSSGDGLERVVINGSVSYDGKPVEAGQIRFRPIEGTSGPITVRPIEAGAYTTAESGGVPLGRHSIEIKSYDAAEYKAKRNRGPGVAAPKQLLPAKYNDKTTLTLDLDADSDKSSVDFQLEK